MSVSPATTRRRMLHFVSRVDDSNAGDSVASPLTHYVERFAAFPFRRHDIRCIDWDAIHHDDVVILGGGVFDHTEFINRAINRLLRVGGPVIAWAPGFNTHFGLSPSFRTPIDFDRFAILTVRDFENEHGIPYLPDVTCVMPQLRTTHAIRRRFGIAHHKDFPLGLPGYDTISNETTVEEILTFIGESEIVVSNSYHMIYWATLMGKPCLSPGGFSTKFDRFEYPPTFMNPGEDLEGAARRARSYDVLDACVEKTELFLADVLAVVRAHVPEGVTPWDAYDLATRAAEAEQRARELQLLPGDIVPSKLLIDTGAGFTDDQRIDATNNVFGDDRMTVTFDLSAYTHIESVRFHPLDGWVSRISVLSAMSDVGDAALIPEGASSAGGVDTFLTTNPWYVSSSPVAGTLEISFHLALVPKAETEWNVLQLDRLARIRTAERDAAAMELTQTYEHLMATGRELDDARSELRETRSRLQRIERSRAWRATSPVRAVARRLRALRDRRR